MTIERKEAESLDSIARKAQKTIHGRYWTLYLHWVEGKLVIEDPNPPRSFMEYIRRPDYSSWFWSVAILLVATLASIYLSSTIQPLTYARYILGSIAVLYLPGYLLIEALYPSPRELSPLERLALSIGLSLAVVPLIGLILNYTPWGIRLDPIIASLTIYDIAMALVALARKYRLTKMIQAR